MADPSTQGADVGGLNPHYQKRMPRWHQVRVIGWEGLALGVVEDAGGVLILQIYDAAQPGLPPPQPGSYHPLTNERRTYQVESNDLGPPVHHVRAPDPTNPARCLKCDLMVLGGEASYHITAEHPDERVLVWNPK
jgi:hypothetical protein